MVGTPSEIVGTPLGSSSEIVVFPPETPPNPSEPIRGLSRQVLDEFGEEKGKVTAEARTRNLWRTTVDYRVSHTARGENLVTCLAMVSQQERTKRGQQDIVA